MPSFVFIDYKLKCHRIIWTILNWDIKDLASRASKIETDKKCLSKDQIECLQDYCNKSQEEQDQMRQQSREYNRPGSTSAANKLQSKIPFQSSFPSLHPRPCLQTSPKQLISWHWNISPYVFPFATGKKS